MARVLSEILNEPEPDFSYRIAHFEKLAGLPSVDLRLVSEMTTNFQKLAKSLGLDQADTTAKEIFFALNKKALEDSEVLAQKIGISDSDSPSVATRKCIKYIERLLGGTRIWSIRSSVLKKELKTNPPKRLLKIIGLRSIDSALKRESLGEILIFSRLLESQTWKTAYINNAKKLTNSDFDFRPIELHLLSRARQSKLKYGGVKFAQVVRSDQETGGLVIATLPKRFKGDVLYITNSLINNINQLKVHSLYLRHKSLEPDFFKIIYKSRQFGIREVANDHLGVGWDTYSKSSRINNENLDEFDFDIEHEYDTLKLHEILEDDVWSNQFLLKSDSDLIVSCNLSDVIINAVNRYEPEDSIVYHAQNELRSELFSRYLNYDHVMNYLSENMEGSKADG